MESPTRELRMIEPSGTRQDERFTIKLPVRYREFGESDWHKGTTENISGAGIFFRCHHSAKVHKHGEIDFVLRSGQNEPLGTQVVCLGQSGREEVRAEAMGRGLLAP